MTCPNCGATVAENRRFCGVCGTALAAAAPPAEPAGAPAFPPPAVPAPPSAWGTPAASAPPGGPGSWPPPTPTDPFAPPDLHRTGGYPPPAYPPPGYSGPPPGYPQPGYGYVAPRTNGLAVASLVLGLVGWLLCGVGSVLAIVLGFVGRDQIHKSWGRETGAGMATAGIVLGSIGVAFWITAFLVSLARGG